MTPEEIRADVERVLEHIYAAYWGGTQSEKRFIGERRIDILLAARKRWRNEALEEAAGGGTECNCESCRRWRNYIRSLKEK